MTISLPDAPVASDPALQVARQVRDQFRFGFDGLDNQVVPVPPGTETRLTRQLANAVQRSLLQIIPVGPQGEDSFASAVWQSVATNTDRRISVRRLYLTAPGYLPKGVATAATTDRFQERFLALRDLTDEKLTLPVSNRWLIDDSAVVSEEPDISLRWEVSVRAVDVQRFQDMWHLLWDRASTEPPGRDSTALTEPLIQSADAMATVAKMSCRKPMYGHDTCSWFHGVWQYLRLFDMVGSPDWHTNFFLNALSAELRSIQEIRHPRVLITGAGDYSMLGYVLNAADGADSVVDVAVLDRCRTPLIACDWYTRFRNTQRDMGAARRHRVHYYERDVLAAKSLAGSRKYDLITTDAYLTRFEPPEASMVVKMWNYLLRPQGTVVTTVRLHPLDAPRGALLDEVSDFTLRAQAAAQRWRPYLKAGVDDITVAAQNYATSMRSYDLGDADSVRSMFLANGFKVEHDDIARTRGELRPATYLRIVARKLSDS